jgi:hypothetical protein
MQGLTKRTAALGAMFLVIGFLLMFAKAPAEANKNEAWMMQRAPDKIAGVEYDHNPETPGLSYKMDKSTYDTLNPFGIVSRVFTYKDARYDTVLIASNAKNSFHDPRICFSGQSYTVEDQAVENVPTQTRGTIPVTFTKLSGGTDGGKFAVFMYKGPDGFTASTNGLKWSMFKHELLTGKQMDGVFYRIIPLDQRTTKEELLAFVGQFVDQANTYSNGYF